LIGPQLFKAKQRELMRKQRGFLSKGIFVLLLTIIMTAAAYFTWQSKSNTVVQFPEEIEDSLFWQARDLTDFTLIGANNKTLGLDDLKGKWSFIFFGYTHCPDICPMSMNIMGTVFKLLKENPAASANIQGVFVSVDPERDTPELLEEYASYFNPEFMGVTGDKAQIDAFTRQIGVLYSIHAKESQEDYSVSHNSTIFLIDPKGRLYGRFPQPHVAREIADIFIEIRAFYDEQTKKQWFFF
jgi:protein SCO1/2